MTLTDEELMTAVSKGDLTQLSILFDRYQGPLFDFFCRMNGTRAGSDDLVQDVFVRILKYRSTFHENGRFRTWMYQVSRSARVEHFRKQPVTLNADEEDVRFSAEASPVRRLELDQDAAMLRCALEMLPDEKRELLVLVWYQEMKYQDIAELLGIDSGAVKVRVHRAIKELRRLFEQVSSEKTPCNVKIFKTTSPIT